MAGFAGGTKDGSANSFALTQDAASDPNASFLINDRLLIDSMLHIHFLRVIRQWMSLFDSLCEVIHCMMFY